MRSVHHATSDTRDGGHLRRPSHYSEGQSHCGSDLRARCSIHTFPKAVRISLSNLYKTYISSFHSYISRESLRIVKLRSVHHATSDTRDGGHCCELSRPSHYSEGQSHCGSDLQARCSIHTFPTAVRISLSNLYKTYI
jgi:hypothetical protein